MLIRILTGCFKGLLELVAWLFLLAGIPIGIFFTVLSSKVGELIQGWFPSFPAEYVTATVLLLSVMLAVVWAIVAFIVSVFTFPPLTILFSIDSRLNDISKKNPILENSDLSDEDIYTISVDGPPVKKPVVIGALVGITFVGCGIAIASGKGTQIEPDVVHRDSYGVMTDSRDGQTYRTIKIGSQTWMAENLNFEYVVKNKPWLSGNCYYNPVENPNEDCKRFGRYYTWAAAMDSAGKYSSNGKGCGHYKRCSPTYPVQGICPEGWHLPDTTEWIILYESIGRNPFAMQAKGNENWEKATNESSFSALPGGYDSKEGFIGDGKEASFWSATKYDYHLAYHWDLDVNDAALYYYGDNYYGRSVRCVKNDEVGTMTGLLSDSRDGKKYKTVNIGNQTWMAENLNFKMSDSDCFENKQKNCEKYGRRYTRNAAMNACPNGWRLPSKSDFVNTAKHYGGMLDDDNGFMWWNTGDFIPNLLDDVVMPEGYYFVNGSDPNVERNEGAVFWTSSDDNHQAYYMFHSKKGTALAMMSRDYAKSKFSVRCVKD